MKYTLFLLFILASVSCKNDKKQSENPEKNMESQAEMPPKKTTYYFIRHAEKELNAATDPHLTDAGLERAAFWAEFFSDKNLDAIYSTNTTRTVQTVIPTLDRTKLELEFYAPNQLYSKKFLKKTYGKTVLVVGHQDSLVQLINKILEEKKYEKIPAKDYGNLYTVIIEKDGSKNTSMKKMDNN